MKNTILLIITILFSTFSFAQLNVNLLGQLTYSQDLSDVWGHVDSLGNEYAIVGVYNGVSIVDLSNPANPTELFFFPGASSIWRDMKTWNNHAYITNESSGGLFIIDLSDLPSTSTPNTTSFTGSSYNFDSAHNLYIDENGICYIFGADYGVGGAILLDLTQDPMAPIELGIFDSYYIHDGMTRGDTLWASHISNGFQSVIDVSNKANPTMMSNWNTPSNFTHNCWISDDGNSLFTTDEKSDAYIGSYDVSDIFNVTEIDRIQSNPGSGVIPHNTHFLNDYIITSYYRDGITIHDVTLPGNMIEVGNYDSYSQGSGDGFNGCWGVYPWLPSGNIIATDIENGFFVLGPNYVRGCYLEGIVTDSITGLPIVGATVTLLLPNETANTDITGNYQMGIADSGTYTVVVSAPGYNDDTLTVTLINGVLVVLNAELYSPQAFSLSGQVVSSIGGTPVANAFVLIENGSNTYVLNADGNGNFTIPSFSEGSYDIVAGQWNYISTCNSGQNILASMGILTITLDPGIYDDFSFDFGWSATGTANTGDWERAEPYGTFYNSSPANPDEDIQSDCLDKAFVTGNNNSNNVGNDDVDNGNVVLTSPVFDLSSYNNPYIEYYTWFFNDGGNSSPDDTLKVSISNGINVVILETIVDNQTTSSWEYSSFVVSDYISLSSTMQLIVETSDLSSSGNLVEAGFDYFRVHEGCSVNSMFTASNTSICEGDSIEFTNSSVGATSYNWYVDNSIISNALNFNYVFDISGTYTISLVSYDSICVDSTVQTITVGSPPSLSTSSTNPICNNDCNGDASVYTTGGSSPFQYSWNTMPVQNSPIATGLCSGTYDVDVVDANGCIATISANLVNPSIMTISIGSTDASCGNADGSASAYVSGGVGVAYNYLWDDPLQQTNDTAVGLSAGSYSVIVTDQGGCSDTAFVSIGNVNGPTITVTSSDASCFSAADGSAAVIATGGLSPYTYLWSDQGGQTSQTAIGLIAGNYSVTVTDAAGCITVGLSSVFHPNDLTVIASTLVSTCDLPNGNASVLVSGGNPPYSYNWDDPMQQTTDVAVGLLGGTYNVVVTDSNGCTKSTAIIVDAYESPALNLTAIDVSCYGLSDGVVASSISGGIAPFTYLWDDLNNQTTPSATGLNAGNYNLTLTDSNGCVVNQNCTIKEPFELLIQVNANDPLVGPCTGNAAVSTSGGTAPYDYLWSNGETSQVISLLCGGTYNVVVTDINGCSVSSSVMINAYTSIKSNIEQDIVIVPNPTEGILRVSYTELYYGEINIAIINMLGELIVEKTYDNSNAQMYFDLSHYPSGMYFIKLTTNTSFYSTNILVK